MKKFIVLSICLALFLGCQTIQSVGPAKNDTLLTKQVDPKYGFFVIRTRGLMSPSTTTVLIFDKEKQVATKIDGGTSPGFLGVMAGPAATAYAGHEIGHGIKRQRPSVTNTTTTVNNSPSTSSRSSSRSKAVAGAIQGQMQGQKQLQGQMQQQGQMNVPFVRQPLPTGIGDPGLE